MLYNFVGLTGMVIKKSEIHRDENKQYALCFVNVVRDNRDVGDGKTIMKIDYPIIMCHDSKIIAQMVELEENDIVEMKGRFSSKRILKTSQCEYCGEKNTVECVLVYIEPFEISKMAHCNTQEEALNMLSSQRKTSNLVLLHGAVSSDPKSIISDEGVTITQYQISLNPNCIARYEEPERSIEHPWVISYGKNATEDKRRLYFGSNVFLHACLQTRTIQKYTLCATCGREYTWEDQKMEIVPYETEYKRKYNTDEDLLKKKNEAT